MATVEGLDRVQAMLKAKAAKGAKASVSVGFTAAYALFIHENTQAYHPVGRAKFLEQPARQMSAQLSKVIEETFKSGKTMSVALLMAGLKLQAAAQRLCPVDTGNLKGSAFTRLDDGAGEQ